MTTAALVLAAGGSRRFTGGDKLSAPLRGRPLVAWAIAHAMEARLDETYVVVGASSLELPDAVVAVHNERWDEGMATSLQAGISAARRAGHGAVVVGLGDEPFVPPDAWRAVAASESPIAVATYGDRQGHPVRLARPTWPLLPTTGDVGARVLIDSQPDLVTRVPCPGTLTDIDTLEDLQTWT